MEPINNISNSYIKTDLITKLNLNNNHIATGSNKTPQKIIISDDVEIEIDNGTYTGKDIRELFELKNKLKSLYPELFLI